MAGSRRTAQIIIQIRGGLRAAADSRRAAGGMDELGDATSKTARRALRAAAALKILDRQVRLLARDKLVAAAAALVMSTALTVLGIVALGVASIALPALAIALYQVIAAVGLLTVALLGSMVGLIAGAAVMAIAVISRFQRMRDLAGSAAARLADEAVTLKETFLDAAAIGADRVLGGIADMLDRITPLVRSLSPVFTAIGTAIGGAFRMFGDALVDMGPEIRAMLGQLPSAIGAAADAAATLLGFLVTLATHGTPILVRALKTLAGWAEGWTEGIQGGALDRALGVLRAFGQGVSAFFGGLAEPLEGIFGPAMSELGTVALPALHDLGFVIGGLLALLMTVGRIALPALMRTFELLTGLIEGKTVPALNGLDIRELGKIGVQVVNWLAGAIRDAIPVIARIVAAFVKLSPFFENVLGPLLSGIFSALMSTIEVLFGALGFLGTKLEFLRPVFFAIGYIIGSVMTGAVLKVFAAVLKAVPLLGKLAPVVGLIGRAFDVAARVIGVVFRGALNIIGRVIAPVIGKVINFVDDLALKFGMAGVRVWLGIRKIVRWITDFVAKFIGKVKSIPVGIVNGLVQAVGGVFEAAKKVGKAIWGGIKSGIKSVGGKLLGTIGGAIGLASGGVMTAGGLTMVGERGPELLYLPAGASVYPNSSLDWGSSRPLANSDHARLRPHGMRVAQPVSADLSGLAESFVLNNQLHLDGRVAAESVDRVRLNSRYRKAGA